MEDFTRPRASGSNLLTVNLESMQDIPVAFPYRWEIDEINQEHRNIPENMVRVAQPRRESRDAQVRIYDVKRRAEQMRAQERKPPGGPRKSVGGAHRHKPSYVYILKWRQDTRRSPIANKRPWRINRP